MYVSFLVTDVTIFNYVLIFILVIIVVYKNNFYMQIVCIQIGVFDWVSVVSIALAFVQAKWENGLFPRDFSSQFGFGWKFQVLHVVNSIYISFRNFNVVIGHIVLLQKSRKHMQQWMHMLCLKYSTSSRQRLSKKVCGTFKFCDLQNLF